MEFEVLEPWIRNTFNSRVFLHEMGQMVPIGSGLDNSLLKSLQPSQHEVTVEGRRVGSETLGSHVNFLVELIIVVNDSASDQIRVSSDVLAAAVVSDISTKQQGGLQVWGGEGVVNDDLDLGVDFLGGLDCFVDVDQLHGGVGGSLDPYHLGGFLDCLGQGLNVGHINKFHIHTVLILTEQSQVSLSSTVHVIAHNQVVTGFQCVDNGRSSTTTAGECNAVFSVLDGGDAFLKGTSGGVAASGVLVFSVWLSDVLLGVG